MSDLSLYPRLHFQNMQILAVNKQILKLSRTYPSLPYLAPEEYLVAYKIFPLAPRPIDRGIHPYPLKDWKENSVICRTWKLERGPLSSSLAVEFNPGSFLHVVDTYM